MPNGSTRDLERLRPDLIIVAGDLTMRSTRIEFADAKSWLEGLEAPLLVLPGNHDLPVWSIFERFTNPFARYSRASGAKLMPVFEDAQSYVLGLNTTASWQPGLTMAGRHRPPARRGCRAPASRAGAPG